MLLIIAISTFVCISLGMLGVNWPLYKPQSAATERLRRLAGGREASVQSMQSAVLPKIVRRLRSAEDRDSAKQTLAAFGN